MSIERWVTNEKVFAAYSKFVAISPEEQKPLSFINEQMKKINHKSIYTKHQLN
jgi:hypothetical protein